MRTLTAIDLLDPTGALVVLPHELLAPTVARLTYEAELGQVPTRTLTLLQASLGRLAGVMYPGTVVRLTYSEAGPTGETVERWRVRRRRVGYHGGVEPQLDLRPQWEDLARIAYLPAQSAGLPATSGRAYWFNVPVEDVLADLLDPDNGAPAGYAVGTVATAYAGAPVALSDVGRTVLDLVSAVAERVRGSGDEDGAAPVFRWDEGDGLFYLDLVERIGEADPGERVIDARNLLALTRDDDAENFASRVVPIGGSGEETFLAGGAVWPVRSDTWALLNANTEAEFRVVGEPIAYDGQFVGGRLTALGGDPTGNHANPILETVAPDYFRVGQTPVGGLPGANGQRTIWESDGAGGFVQVNAFVDEEAEAAFGRAERVVEFPGATPYDNAVEGFASPDLSEWDGGLPVGFEAVFSPTVTEETGEEWVRHGTKAARVDADDGEGLRVTVTDFATPGLGTQTYVSAWLSIRVVAGTVRLAVEAGAGGSFAVVEGADGPLELLLSDDTTLEVALQGGADDVLLDYRVVAVAHGGPAEFVWDAVTLTFSPTAYPLTPLMGPRSLWAAARRELASDQGGLGLVVGFEGQVVDLAGVGLAADAVHLGDNVALTLDGVAVGAARATGVAWEERPLGPAQGPIEKRVRLGRPRLRLTERRARVRHAGDDVALGLYPSTGLVVLPNDADPLDRTEQLEVSGPSVATPVGDGTYRFTLTVPPDAVLHLRPTRVFVTRNAPS